MNYGFVKTACVTPNVKVADCNFNSEQIVSQILYSTQHEAVLTVFPELCVTGYTCGDLFLNSFLINQAQKAVEFILTKTKDFSNKARVHSGLYKLKDVSCNGKEVENLSEQLDVKGFFVDVSFEIKK